MVMFLGIAVRSGTDTGESRPGWGAKRESERGCLHYSTRRQKLRKDGLGVGVKSEFLEGIRPRVERTVIHSRVRDGEEEGLAKVCMPDP